MFSDEVVRARSGALFQQAEWLDAVAPGQWGEVATDMPEGDVATWRFLVRDIEGARVICTPDLTQTLGPQLPRGNLQWAKGNALSEGYRALRRLVEQLPPHDALIQACNTDFWHVVPMIDLGFACEVRATYQIGASEVGVWSQGTSELLRRDLVKASRTYPHVESVSWAEAAPLFQATFSRAIGGEPPWPMETARRLVEGMSTSQRGLLLGVRSGEGRLDACVFLALDQDTAYYLLGGSNEYGRRGRGLKKLLEWGVNWALQSGRNFDFEGSHLATVEPVFRSFGARALPYLVVSRASDEIHRLVRPGEHMLPFLWRWLGAASAGVALGYGKGSND